MAFIIFDKVTLVIAKEFKYVFKKIQEDLLFFILGTSGLEGTIKPPLPNHSICFTVTDQTVVSPFINQVSTHMVTWPRFGTAEENNYAEMENGAGSC